MSPILRQGCRASLSFPGARWNSSGHLQHKSLIAVIRPFSYRSFYVRGPNEYGVAGREKWAAFSLVAGQSLLHLTGRYFRHGDADFPIAKLQLEIAAYLNLILIEGA
jgi:hypothetical protein